MLTIKPVRIRDLKVEIVADQLRFELSDPMSQTQAAPFFIHFAPRNEKHIQLVEASPEPYVLDETYVPSLWRALYAHLPKEHATVWLIIAALNNALHHLGADRIDYWVRGRLCADNAEFGASLLAELGRISRLEALNATRG